MLAAGPPRPEPWEGAGPGESPSPRPSTDPGAEERRLRDVLRAAGVSKWVDVERSTDCNAPEHPCLYSMHSRPRCGIPVPSAL